MRCWDEFDPLIEKKRMVMPLPQAGVQNEGSLFNACGDPHGKDKKL